MACVASLLAPCVSALSEEAAVRGGGASSSTERASTAARLLLAVALPLCARAVSTGVAWIAREGRRECERAALVQGESRHRHRR
eukprot:1621128-Rhodomonas_salina.1